MTADEPTRLFTPPDFAVLIAAKEQTVQEIARENFVDASGGAIDKNGIEQVSASIALRNPGLGENVAAEGALVLPLSVGTAFFLKKPAVETPPKLPDAPPKQNDDSPPPDPTIPGDPIWDWDNHATLWTGSDVAEPDGCKGHLENVIEKDGTQEARSRAGSFVFVRLKVTEEKPLFGAVPIKREYAEVVRAARYAVRTWQLQRTAQYFVEICPTEPKNRRTRQKANKAVWVQLHPDEYIAGPPEEVLEVDTGDVGPAGGAGLAETPKDKAQKAAKDYAKNHPGVIYDPKLDGKQPK